MSAEQRERHPNLKSVVSKGQCGSRLPVKCCHYLGCKPVNVPKQRLNSLQSHSSNNYMKRHTIRNLKPANSKQHIQKIHRKDVFRQWEESKQKGNLEQGESELWSNVVHNEMSTQWEEFKQVNHKEQDNTQELGCGEELAQHTMLDWEVDLEQGEGFNSKKCEGSLKLLSDFYSDREEEIRGVAGRLYREKEEVEGWEVDGNGKAVSLMSPVHCAKRSTVNRGYKYIAQKDALKTNTSVKLSDNIYSDEIFSDYVFSDRFYQSHIYTNGIKTDELCSHRSDTISMFPDVSDAGEALADAEGLSECDLFEQIDPSLSVVEKGGEHRDAVMLSEGEGSESSGGSLSFFDEEDSEGKEHQVLENSSLVLGSSSQDLHSGISQSSSHSDVSLYAKSEGEAGIFSELPPHEPSSSFDSVCKSESKINANDMEMTATSHRPWSEQAEPTTKLNPSSDSIDLDRTSEINLPSPQTEIQNSHKIQLEQCNAQEEDKSKSEESKSGMSEAHTEEHVYEETEPTFQTKSFLQTRRYLMTRSISVEAPSNRLDPMNNLLGKERLMLHPQSYYTHHNLLGDSLPALTGSLGCLSPGCPCPSNDLGTTAMAIPPPFELSSITKRPIRKSTPAIPSELSVSCRKLDFGFKRYFLPLRFLRKSERRSLADNRSVSSRSSSESSPQGSCRKLNLLRPSMGSPELQRAHDFSLPSSPASFLQKGKQRKDLRTPFNNNVVSATPTSWDMLGAGSDEFIHSSFIKTLSLSKPRSFSSPNVDSSVYENVLNTSPHYENVQLRLLNPSNLNRGQASSNDTDGYVDMSSLPGFQNKIQPSEETESAYTICSPTIRVDGTVGVSVEVSGTKKEDNKLYERQTVSCSRTFYNVKELLDSETQHVKTVKLLCETVGTDERLSTVWSDLPAIYTLHQDLQTQLETRIKEWDQRDGVADIILAKKEEFPVFSSFISHHDNKVKSLEQMESTVDLVVLKQQLLQVIVRVLQYRMLLTDYLNNLSPNSREYEDTKAALEMVTEVADQAHNGLNNGASLLRLVHIEHSVLGLKNLLQPGRVFVKEGTLMKVSSKCKQPRHLILMSDILLYTYPQQDGKFRLINTLALAGMEVTKVQIENAQNALKVEFKDISITLSASSSIERDDWFVTLNRTIADHGCFEFGEKPGACLGENAPPLVSTSQVPVCMNCPTHFSLTHRRHHCHACGKVVCRDCCRNKVRLKYMKNRRAKVCDKCYSELARNEEGDAAVVTESPSRPLSAVFQNIHPTSMWRGRKGQVSFNQVTDSEGEISGTLQRSRNSKRSWKSLWFLLKDKVLYAYPQPEERVACESLPLLGFSVRSESEGESSVFQLYHKTTLYYTFRAQDTHTAQRWVSAMEEATVL